MRNSKGTFRESLLSTGLSYNIKDICLVHLNKSKVIVVTFRTATDQVTKRYFSQTINPWSARNLFNVTEDLKRIFK